MCTRRKQSPKKIHPLKKTKAKLKSYLGNSVKCKSSRPNCLVSAKILKNR